MSTTSGSLSSRARQRELGLLKSDYPDPTRRTRPVANKYFVVARYTRHIQPGCRPDQPDERWRFGRYRRLPGRGAVASGGNAA